METNDYKWLDPPFMLIPYSARNGIFKPDDLVTLYWRLKQEKLYNTVFHDNPEMNLAEFIVLFNSQAVSLQILCIVADGQIKDMAGMAWLAPMEQYLGRQRGNGSFVAFQNYQTATYTDQMARMVLRYWFDELGMAIVTGMTPTGNHLACRFVKRIGFKELCVIPDYMSLNGVFTDCLITWMNRSQYAERYGGK